MMEGDIGYGQTGGRIVWRLYATYGAGYAVKDERGVDVCGGLSSSDVRAEAVEIAKGRGLDVEVIRDESLDE